MNFTLYHNPHCSKSRQTLELIREHGIQPAIVPYLEQPPAPATLMRLAKMLDMPVKDLVRPNDVDEGETPPTGDDAAAARWLSEHPRALQRPIVVDEDAERAVVGRPPANVLELLSRCARD
jgi:arsenate reductase